MRLQLAILRHALPPCHILYTTGAGPASHTTARSATIADLLADVDILVPLESSKGEWGLEDYVVEVAATADQAFRYECLHYSEIRQVLREDDEVVIRALKTEEIRERRVGGRFQVAGDGRHLIDGVAWGRRRIRADTGRPGIRIPARKRQRLLNENDTEGEEYSLAITNHEGLAADEPAETDDDDEDDEDFEDSSYEGENDTEDEQQLMITATAQFDDADVDEDKSSDEESGREDSDNEVDIVSANALELSDELKALLEDAEEELSNAEANLGEADAVEVVITSRSGKRKRNANDDGDFEGFLTPTAPRGRKVNGIHEIEDNEESEALSEPDSSTPSSSGSDSSRDTDGSSLYESSSSDSEGETDSEEETSSSESESESDSDTSVLNPTSNDKEKAIEVAGRAVSKKHPLVTIAPSTAPSTTLHDISSHSAPGQGLTATRSRNERNKKLRRLRYMKEQGLLPPDAGFAAMYAYEEDQAQTAAQTIPDDAESVQQAAAFEHSVEEKKQHLLLQLMSESQEVYPDHMPSDQRISNEEPGPSMGVVVQDSEVDEEYVDPSVPPTIDTPTNERVTDMTETGSEPPKKRAKLDLASSRRMLFGSLGVRNPTTHAAEQALREKLSQPIRKTTSTRVRDEDSERIKDLEQQQDHNQVSSKNDDDWRSKILLSAQECEEDEVTLTAPPFPFEQWWDEGSMRRNKKKARKDSQYYQTDEEVYENGYSEYAPDISTIDQVQGAGEIPDVQSKTTSALPAEIEDIPRPADLTSLAPLILHDVVPGAIIAFKEWEINANGEPGVSDYRVARVLSIDKNSLISLVLSKSDRDAAIRSKYDQVTGERIFSRFEVPSEDAEEEVETGQKSFLFQDLQEPKMVLRSTVQVPASNHSFYEDRSQRESSVKGDSTYVPESAAKKVLPMEGEVSTATNAVVTGAGVSIPQREEINGIMKEAGFHFALDEALLHPISKIRGDSAAEEGQELSSSQPQLNSSIQYHMTEGHASSGNKAFDNNRFESSCFNGWSSSPRLEVDDATGGGLDENRQSAQRSNNSTPQSPTMSQVVLYPHISQPDITESPVVSNINSSSHQDAQKIPQEADPDVSIRPFDDIVETERQEDFSFNAIDSMELRQGKEVDNSPRSVTRPLDTREDDQDLPSPQRDSAFTNNSFLGLGHDGPVSLGSDGSYHDAGNGSESDSDLPSLRQLSSSQVKRTRAASRKAGISPPPLKKGNRLRNGNKRREPGSVSNVEPVSSQRQSKFKVSASQREQRSSQIPAGTQVIDLTPSSDPVSPSGSDADYGARKGKKDASKGKASERTRTRTRERGMTDGLEQLDSGLGSKKFLISKKRSRV